MVGFDQVVSQVMFNITGLSVDITTLAVGAIVIFVLLLGLDLVLASMGFDSHEFFSSGKQEKKKKEFSAKDNEDKYKKYSSNRYWKEQYKSRYERDFKKS